MHLSLLSDSFLSDRLNDSGVHVDQDVPTLGRAHRDGLVRGLCFASVLALPVILALVPSVADEASAAISTVVRIAAPAGAMPPWHTARRS